MFNTKLWIASPVTGELSSTSPLQISREDGIGAQKCPALALLLNYYASKTV